MYSNELYHYGVKGMKWGVRRSARQLGHYTSATAKGTSAARTNERLQKTMRNKRIVDKVESVVNKHYEKKISKLQKTYDKKVKDLSPKEIKRGENFYKGLKVARNVSIGAFVGAGINANIPKYAAGTTGIMPVGMINPNGLTPSRFITLTRDVSYTTPSNAAMLGGAAVAGASSVKSAIKKRRKK